MNEFQTPAKFLTWIVGVLIVLGLFSQLGPLTYKAAEMAIDAHESHQMCYGNFSR